MYITALKMEKYYQKVLKYMDRSSSITNCMLTNIPMNIHVMCVRYYDKKTSHQYLLKSINYILFKKALTFVAL